MASSIRTGCYERIYDNFFKAWIAGQNVIIEKTSATTTRINASRLCKDISETDFGKWTKPVPKFEININEKVAGTYVDEKYFYEIVFWAKKFLKKTWVGKLFLATSRIHQRENLYLLDYSLNMNRCLKILNRNRILKDETFRIVAVVDSKDVKRDKTVVRWLRSETDEQTNFVKGPLPELICALSNIGEVDTV